MPGVDRLVQGSATVPVIMATGEMASPVQAAFPA